MTTENQKQLEVLNPLDMQILEAKNFLKKNNYAIISEQEFAEQVLKRRLMACFIGLTGIFLGISLTKLMGW